MKIYNIENGSLFNDLDCLYDKENNRIDVYSSVYWSAENEKEYLNKENIINNFTYEDDLIKVNAWCDVSGFDYWVIKQEELNYVSIDVYLKKNVKDYTQEEIKFISDKIVEFDNLFQSKLL